MDTDKRAAILEAASALFAQRGNVSMEEIARRAGVSKATLYQLGENKTDLFYQCVHRQLQHWTAHVGLAFDPRKSIVEVLPAMCLAGIAFAHAHGLVRGLFAGVYAGSLSDWRTEFEQLRRMGNTPIAELLRHGMRRGELRADLDVETLAAQLQDMTYAGFVVYGDSWGTPALAERWVKAQCQLCLYGLRRR